MKVTTYKYVKVAVEETEVFIPEEPFFCFETGLRRSIRMIPEFVDWEGPDFGKVYSLVITCVYLSFECKVEKFRLPLSRVEPLLNHDDKSVRASIAQLLLNGWYHKRTKAQFDADLTAAIENINFD